MRRRVLPPAFVGLFAAEALPFTAMEAWHCAYSRSPVAMKDAGGSSARVRSFPSDR